MKRHSVSSSQGKPMPVFIVLNNQLPNQNDLKLSIPFLQSPLTMVMANDRNKKLPVTKVGMTHIMNKYFVEELLQNTPGIEETVRNSPYALLKALNAGRIDAAYINVYSANAFLSWPEFSHTFLTRTGRLHCRIRHRIFTGNRYERHFRL